MSLRLDISDIKNHATAAAQLLDYAGMERVFFFDAPMGAGKTTFIKSVCQHLKVVDTMSSPTYAVVNEYVTLLNHKVFHFDLYRLKSSLELLEIGFEEYISTDAYLFIEWPELAAPLVDAYVKVTIELNQNIRYLCAEIIPER
jgi:tRNA threonylcarbamoyladenosine biosynthesis protein TsaE